MKGQRKTIEIPFQITDVVKKGLHKIKSSYEAVSCIYHLLNQFEGDSVPLMETDNLAFVIEEPEFKESLSLRDRTLDWLFRKAFEDFIAGINESLIEAHKAVSLAAYSKRSQTTAFTHDEILKSIETISKKPIKLPIPQLIKDIEKILGKTLSFRDEILSVNKVRNCLVHRNGIVTVEDTNNTEKTLLLLKCYELRVNRELDGEMIQMTREDKKAGFQAQHIQIQMKHRIVEFGLGSHINIDSNILNDVNYTCSSFASTLLEAAVEVYHSNSPSSN